MEKSNVILITIDECKATALSPYGNPYVSTPGAEYAAAGGTLFEQSYTCHPKCVPSRCSLLSGRYAHTNGHRTLPGFELEEGEVNLAALLKENGYKTAMFGKNHTVTESYKPLCFDEYTTNFSHGERKHKEQGDNEDILFRAFYRGRWDDVFDEPPQDYFDTLKAVDFIKRHTHTPFFLLVNLTFPHPAYYGMSPYFEALSKLNIPLPPKHPLDNAPETLKQYRAAYGLEELTDEQLSSIVNAYYSMVSYVDHCVAQIYQTVEDCGIKENTVVIYTSDHGDFAGEHGCVEKYDTLFYDCIMRIPLYIQYPPLIRQGLRLDSMVENVDIAPTVLELLDLPIPPNIHGKSLVPYLTGQSKNHKDCVFCEGGVEDYAIAVAPHYDSNLCERMRPRYYTKQKVLIDYPLTMQRAKVVRTKEWKLIYRQNGGKELYHMIDDPNEHNNLAAQSQYAGVIAELMELLLQWLIRTEPDEPKIKNLYA